MKMREVQVSDEYIQTLCKKMLEWVKKPDAYTVPQFLQWKGVGYPYLKYLIHVYPQVCNTFEVMKSILNNRWFHMAMKEYDLPPHRAKVLLRYLRLYDSHALDVEEESRKKIAEVENKLHMQYIAENYDRSQLREPYKGIYEQNVDKRRGSKKAQRIQA